MSSLLALLDNGDESRITLKDVTCPVCFSILIEPVSLRCRHPLCLACYTKTLSTTSSSCPICRERIGNWGRKSAKEGNLVDSRLWNFLKDRFKERVEARLNGVDSQELEDEIEEMTSIHKDSNEDNTLVLNISTDPETEEMKQRKADEERSLQLARKIIEDEEKSENERQSKEKEEKLQRRRSRQKSVNPLPEPRTKVKITSKRIPAQDHNDNMTFSSPLTKSRFKNLNKAQNSCTGGINCVEPDLNSLTPTKVAPPSPATKLSRSRQKRPLSAKNECGKIESSNKEDNNESMLLQLEDSVTDINPDEEKDIFDSSKESLPSCSNTVPPVGDDNDIFKELMSAGIEGIDESVIEEQREIEMRFQQEKLDLELAAKLQKEDKVGLIRTKGSDDYYKFRETPKRKGKPSETTSSKKKSISKSKVAFKDSYSCKTEDENFADDESRVKEPTSGLKKARHPSSDSSPMFKKRKLKRKASSISSNRSENVASSDDDELDAKKRPEAKRRKLIKTPVKQMVGVPSSSSVKLKKESAVKRGKTTKIPSGQTVVIEAETLKSVILKDEFPEDQSVGAMSFVDVANQSKITRKKSVSLLDESIVEKEEDNIKCVELKEKSKSKRFKHRFQDELSDGLSSSSAKEKDRSKGKKRIRNNLPVDQIIDDEVEHLTSDKVKDESEGRKVINSPSDNDRTVSREFTVSPCF